MGLQQGWAWLCGSAPRSRSSSAQMHVSSLAQTEGATHLGCGFPGAVTDVQDREQVQPGKHISSLGSPHSPTSQSKSRDQAHGQEQGGHPTHHKAPVKGYCQNHYRAMKNWDQNFKFPKKGRVRVWVTQPGAGHQAGNLPEA